MARPRKPTQLKIVAGTAQNCRLNPNEPKPERGVPLPPSHLSPKARLAWKYVAQVLDDMGVITQADAMALEGACESYADLRNAREALKNRGSLTYEAPTDSGGVLIRKYPEVDIVAEADRRFKGWLAVLGMTPADRSRVSAGSKGDGNPFADL